MDTICIYHDDCTDGFGAAWVIRQALGPDVEFHAGIHGVMPPDVTGKHVVLVDFSYKRDVMKTLIAQARSVLVLDHHKSAQAELAGLSSDRVRIVFDMLRSGAMLAWNWYFMGQPAPDLITRIQDIDLWRFDYADTRDVMAAVGSYDYDFEVWSDLMRRDMASLVIEGRIISRKMTKDLHTALAVTQRQVTFEGFEVPMANLPRALASEGGSLMSKEAPFAIVYHDGKDTRNFSLRSSNGIDVSTIAAKFGGGGHPTAAGFRLPREEVVRLGLL